MRHTGWAMTALLVGATAPVAPTVALDGHGLLVAGKAATFETTTRAAATAPVATALGKPIGVGSHGDCGQKAVIAFAKFRGGFELSFTAGRLSGWTADGPSPRTTKGIAVGATVAALRRAYSDVDLDASVEANGGAGPSFQREGGPDGWLDGMRPTSKITGLFAGATCLAGV